MSSACSGCNGQKYGCEYEDFDRTYCDDKNMINGMTDLAYQQGIADERKRIVMELEEAKDVVPVNRLLDDIINDKPKELGMLIAFDKAIEIARGEQNE